MHAIIACSCCFRAAQHGQHAAAAHPRPCLARAICWAPAIPLVDLQSHCFDFCRPPRFPRLGPVQIRSKSPSALAARRAPLVVTYTALFSFPPSNKQHAVIWPFTVPAHLQGWPRQHSTRCGDGMAYKRTSQRVDLSGRHVMSQSNVFDELRPSEPRALQQLLTCMRSASGQPSRRRRTTSQEACDTRLHVQVNSHPSPTAQSWVPVHGIKHPRPQSVGPCVLLRRLCHQDFETPSEQAAGSDTALPGPDKADTRNGRDAAQVVQLADAKEVGLLGLAGCGEKAANAQQMRSSAAPILATALRDGLDQVDGGHEGHRAVWLKNTIMLGMLSRVCGAGSCRCWRGRHVDQLVALHLVRTFLYRACWGCAGKPLLVAIQTYQKHSLHPPRNHPPCMCSHNRWCPSSAAGLLRRSC